MPYDRLLREEVDGRALSIYEKSMSPRNKGFYGENVIWINKNLPTFTEKACILAEELGHYHTTAGDITDQTSISNRKQERRARVWAYERLIPLSSIVRAHKAGIHCRHDFAEFLHVTEDFLDAAIRRYREKYGISVKINGYTICFDPLGVVEFFE